MSASGSSQEKVKMVIFYVVQLIDSFWDKSHGFQFQSGTAINCLYNTVFIVLSYDEKKVKLPEIK